MLDEAPHILQVRTIIPPENDEYGRPIPGTGGESWSYLADCFCHDNSQMQEESVNGKLWVYAYHVVYEDEKLPLGTMVRCKDKVTEEVVGEGKVIKSAECYSEELKGRCDIWVE